MARSLTQEALAERAGITAAAIAALERGRRRTPRLSTVLDLAEALELDPGERAALIAAAAGPPDHPEPPARAVEPRLPVPLTPLVGRRLEVDAVVDEVLSGRLVTLLGPGGVGKTRLALAVAGEAGAKHPGGVWWIELGPIEDPHAVAGAVLSALGAREQPGRSAAGQLAATVAGAPTLLVLDNCEHVIEAAAALVAEALVEAGELTVLATSREPLGLPGEVTWPVPALTVPDVDDLAALADIDSVRLFVDRASRAQPSFTLAAETAAAVATICRRLDGMPLAIELAASQCRTLPLVSIAEQLDRRLGGLGATVRGVPDRQRTLWASVDWSYQLLDDEEQGVFRRLAAFAGPFLLGAVPAVAGPADVFVRLVDKSLVAPVPGAEPQFRMLETIRGYAAARAAEAGDLAPARDAHADYCYRWLVEAGADEPSDATVAAIEAAYPNLRAALEWSIERSRPLAWQLVDGLGGAWHLMGRFHDAVTLGDAALALAKESDDGIWAHTVGALAMARLFAGDNAFIANTVPAAAAIARAAGDALTEGRCRVVLGVRPPFDAGHLKAAYELGGRAGSPSLAAIAAGTMASVGGGDEQAQRWLAEADRFAADVDNSSIDAIRAIARSDQLIEAGHLAAAADLVEPLAADRRVTPAIRSLLIGRLATIAFYRLDHELAERSARLAADLARVWLAGGFAGVDMAGRRLALLAGERPSVEPLTALAGTTRLGLQPGAVRTICRNAVDAGTRIDPALLAEQAASSAVGPLMSASITSIDALHARLDGDLDRSRSLWEEVLAVARQRGYRLLEVDALEGLGQLADAEALRAETGYRFRFWNS